jgi:hypothetical protein
MRRAAIHTAATAKAANTTLLIRTMTIEAESKAGGEINVLTALSDMHGPPLLIGFALGAVLRLWRDERQKLAHFELSDSKRAITR